LHFFIAGLSLSGFFLFFSPRRYFFKSAAGSGGSVCFYKLITT